MNAPVALPGIMPPMPAVARILARYDRTKLEAFIAVAIDLLDVLDAPSVETEPDFSPHRDGKPGDPADHEPGGDEECGPWAEWQTTRAHERRRGYLPVVSVGNEDDEDDDPAEDSDNDTAIDDGPCDRDDDSEHEPLAEPSYGIDQSNGPEQLADSEDRAIMEAHRDRVRRDHCKPYADAWGGARYRLLNPAARGISDPRAVVLIDSFSLPPAHKM